MNANELADEVEIWGKDLLALNMRGGIPVIEGAKMLRQQQEKLTKYELRHVAQRDRIAILEMQHKQQQAEIEALKGEIDDLMKRIIDLRPYKQKIEAMEKAYDAHFKKALGQ